MKMSKHAIIRSQQRGIPPELIELLIKYGKPTRKPGNALAYSLSRRQANLIIQDAKHFIRVIEKAQGVVAVENNDPAQEIITIYHRR